MRHVETADPAHWSRRPILWIMDESTEDQRRFSQRIPLAALAEALTDGEIETRIGSLKTTLPMNLLQSKRVVNVHSEVPAAVFGA